MTGIRLHWRREKKKHRIKQSAFDKHEAEKGVPTFRRLILQLLLYLLKIYWTEIDNDIFLSAFERKDRQCVIYLEMGWHGFYGYRKKQTRRKDVIMNPRKWYKTQSNDHFKSFFCFALFIIQVIGRWQTYNLLQRLWEKTIRINVKKTLCAYWRTTFANRVRFPARVRPRIEP